MLLKHLTSVKANDISSSFDAYTVQMVCNEEIQFISSSSNKGRLITNYLPYNFPKLVYFFGTLTIKLPFQGMGGFYHNVVPCDAA